MRVVWILLLDSMRMLKSQKMFWLVLMISTLVALTYSSVGFHETGYSVLFGLWDFESDLIRKGAESAKSFYILLFTDFIVKWWLGLAAIFLALVSCGSIFPEFLRKGAIDLALSKPVKRWQLFVAKYLSSLLFVILQVGVFAVIVFFALGLRLGEWNVSVFWAVPVLTFVFSLIYCVSVLIAVKTNSTALSLLGALGLWGTTLVLQWGEDLAYKFAYTLPKLGMSVEMGQPDLQLSERKEDGGDTLKNVHRITRAAIGPMPKTREATLLLNRLIKVGDGKGLVGMDLTSVVMGEIPDSLTKGVMAATQERFSIFYIVWTSLAFEGTVLLLAGWMFCRRDY